MGTLVLCLVSKFSNRHSFGFLTDGVQNQSRFLDRIPVSKKRAGTQTYGLQHLWFLLHSDSGSGLVLLGSKAQAANHSNQVNRTVPQISVTQSKDELRVSFLFHLSYTWKERARSRRPLPLSLSPGFPETPVFVWSEQARRSGSFPLLFLNPSYSSKKFPQSPFTFSKILQILSSFCSAWSYSAIWKEKVGLP